MVMIERFEAPPDGSLSPAMTEAWSRDGFLVLEGFVDDAVCDALMARVEVLVEGFDPGEVVSVFSARGESQARDDYFATSGGEVRFFFEEDAVDEAGRPRVDKRGALAKIGHALHDKDPVFDRFSRTPRLARLAASLGLRRPRLLQSMLIFKNPRVGGEVGWHQDNTFLKTEPMSTVGFWFALEDATVDNGCMWALPGQHRAPLRQRFARSDKGIAMETLDPTPWSDSGAVALAVPRGTLVLLHGSLPHGSRANLSAHPRPAYALHVIDGAARYLKDNWLQRDEPLRGF